jgi:hypothetical protein
MASNITCLVTLHDIGFEQPPQDGVDNSGYADPLQQHFKKCLEEELSDDPNRERNKPGDNGAIYVESRWPDEQGNASGEEGMKRLGTWCDNKQGIDTTDAPLVKKDARDGSISHVALVYSKLEPKGPEIGATLVTLGPRQRKLTCLCNQTASYLIAQTMCIFPAQYSYFI